MLLVLALAPDANASPQHAPGLKVAESRVDRRARRGRADATYGPHAAALRVTATLGGSMATGVGRSDAATLRGKPVAA